MKVLVFCLVLLSKKVITERTSEKDFINFASEKFYFLHESNLDLSVKCFQQMQFWGWSLINNRNAVWADKSFILCYNSLKKFSNHNFKIFSV